MKAVQESARELESVRDKTMMHPPQPRVVILDCLRCCPSSPVGGECQDCAHALDPLALLVPEEKKQQAVAFAPSLFTASVIFLVKISTVPVKVKMNDAPSRPLCAPRAAKANGFSSELRQRSSRLRH